MSRLHRLDAIHDRVGAAPRSCRVPGLATAAAGHGTTWQECNQTTWTDWYTCVDEAFMTLHAQCDQVFLAGLVDGRRAGLRLAEQHGSAVSGLTSGQSGDQHQRSSRMRALPILRLGFPRWPGSPTTSPNPAYRVGLRPTAARALYSQTFLWADVRRNLNRVDQPLLVYRAIHDHVADPSSVRLIKAGVRSSDQTYIELQRSYHVATLDYDAEDIFDGSVAFFRRLTKEADGTAE